FFRPYPPLHSVVMPATSEGEAVAGRTKPADRRGVDTGEDRFGVVRAIHRACARADGFERLSGGAFSHSCSSRSTESRRDRGELFWSVILRTLRLCVVRGSSNF